MYFSILNIVMQTVLSKMHVLSSYLRKILASIFDLIYTIFTLGHYSNKSCKIGKGPEVPKYPKN